MAITQIIWALRDTKSKQEKLIKALTELSTLLGDNAANQDAFSEQAGIELLLKRAASGDSAIQCLALEVLAILLGKQEAVKQVRALEGVRCLENALNTSCERLREKAKHLLCVLLPEETVVMTLAGQGGESGCSNTIMHQRLSPRGDRGER